MPEGCIVVVFVGGGLSGSHGALLSFLLAKGNEGAPGDHRAETVVQTERSEPRRSSGAVPIHSLPRRRCLAGVLTQGRLVRPCRRNTQQARAWPLASFLSRLGRSGSVSRPRAMGLRRLNGHGC